MAWSLFRRSFLPKNLRLLAPFSALLTNWDSSQPRKSYFILIRVSIHKGAYLRTQATSCAVPLPTGLVLSELIEAHLQDVVRAEPCTDTAEVVILENELGYFSPAGHYQTGMSLQNHVLESVRHQIHDRIPRCFIATNQVTLSV